MTKVKITDMAEKIPELITSCGDAAEKAGLPRAIGELGALGIIHGLVETLELHYQGGKRDEHE